MIPKLQHSRLCAELAAIEQLLATMPPSNL